MIARVILSSYFVSLCAGVIYRLNDSDYYRMPALFALDDYQSCVSQPNGVYCLARFNLHADHANELMRLIQEYTDFKIRHFNHSYVERGICVSKTCSRFYEDADLEKDVDLNLVIEKCFNDLLWKEYELKSNLSRIFYCDTNGEQQEPDIGDGIVLSVIVFILILNLVGSCYEMYFEKTGRKLNSWFGHVFLSSFSLRQNWKWLTTTESSDPKVKRLQGLHGIRAAVIFLSIFSHTIFTITTFTDNPHEFEKTHEKFYYYLIYNGLVLMQIVFMMAGFLMAYNLEVRTENLDITWKTFFKVLFLRQCRLGPGNVIVLLCTMTWLRHLGSGPLWKLYVTDSLVKDCRKYWWHHILYINNYMNEGSYCIVPTWHLAADTQLFIVGLMVHIATKHRGRKIMLALLLLVGIVSPALHVLLQDLDPLVIVDPEFYRTNRNDTFYMMHTLAHNNLAAYIIGMITGYLVYQKQKTGKSIMSKKTFSRLYWCIIPALMYTLLLGRLFYMEGYEPSLPFKLLYAATQRVVMSIITAIAIVCLVFKLNDTLCRILEWHGWVIPSRLTYAVFLIHMDIVHILLGLRTQLSHVSFFLMLMTHFAVVVLAFLLALPFHLTIEAPINRMVKTILDYNGQHMEKKKK